MGAGLDILGAAAGRAGGNFFYRTHDNDGKVYKFKHRTDSDKFPFRMDLLLETFLKVYWRMTAILCREREAEQKLPR